MKINNVGPAGMNPYKKNINRLEEAKQSSFQAKDKLEISTTAKELQQTSQVITQRQERREALKVSVQNGTYTLDAGETAKSIVDFYRKN